MNKMKHTSKTAINCNKVPMRAATNLIDVFDFGVRQFVVDGQQPCFEIPHTHSV